MEALTADDDAFVADEEIESPRLRTELGAGLPVVRGHLVTEVGRRGPRDRKRHRARLVDSTRSQVDEKRDVIVANRRQLDGSGVDPKPEHRPDLLERRHRPSLLINRLRPQPGTAPRTSLHLTLREALPSQSYQRSGSANSPPRPG